MFIEVTSASAYFNVPCKHTYILNADQILYFREFVSGTMITLVDGTSMRVEEVYEDVKEFLNFKRYGKWNLSHR